MNAGLDGVLYMAASLPLFLVWTIGMGAAVVTLRQHRGASLQVLAVLAIAFVSGLAIECFYFAVTTFGLYPYLTAWGMRMVMFLQNGFMVLLLCALAFVAVIGRRQPPEPR